MSSLRRMFTSLIRRVRRKHGDKDPYIQELIRQALVDLPSAVTVEFEMKSLEMLLYRADSNEDDWIKIVMHLIPTLPLANPLSGALISIMLDLFPLPSLDVVSRLVTSLEQATATISTTKEKKNLLVVIGVLADKLAGRSSEVLMSDTLLKYLFKTIREDNDQTVTLYSLLAIENFAKTRANKTKLLDNKAAVLLRELEDRYCLASNAEKQPRDNSVRASSRLAKMIRDAEIGFCSMWALDNVFPCDGRKYAVERTDVSRVNVMLDYKDATKFLKLAPDGLEARNDAMSFESVRATCSACDSGVWFYEVTVLTNGIMQIGWATDKCAYKSDEGIGIGDDAESFSYDGCRQLLWHQQKCIRHKHPKWKPGDVLGLYLDLSNRKVNFAHNGKLLEWQALPIGRKTGFYPAVSLMTYQHVHFNFGNTSYQYPPEMEFRSLNGVGRMTDEEKTIVPRLVTLARLQEEMKEEVHEVECPICFDNPPQVMLLPCKHSDLCFDCSIQCEKCPMCRAKIEERKDLNSGEMLVIEADSDDEELQEPDPR